MRFKDFLGRDPVVVSVPASLLPPPAPPVETGKAGKGAPPAKPAKGAAAVPTPTQVHRLHAWLCEWGGRALTSGPPCVRRVAGSATTARSL